MSTEERYREFRQLGYDHITSRELALLTLQDKGEKGND